MKKVFLLLFLLAAAHLISARSFSRVYTVTMVEVKKALEELSHLRRTREEEQIPLAEQLRELEYKVLTKRKEADRLKRLRDNREVDFSTLEERIRSMKEDNRYLSGLLGDYIRRFETQIHSGERMLYQEKIDKAKHVAENRALNGEEKFEVQLEAIDTAFGRLERVMGGDTFKGPVVMSDGSYEEGVFAAVGPIVYFSSKSGKAGLAKLVLDSTNAIVQEVNPRYRHGIKSLAYTNQGIVPVDATLGDALKVEATKENFVEHIKKGGIVMYPILALAAFAFIVGIFKWLEINGVGRARQQDLNITLQHLKAGEQAKAMAHAKSVKGPVGDLLQAAVEHFKEGQAFLKGVFYEKVLETQPRLERLLPLIAVTAASAPLLGLLGTVTGMIKTFQLITVFGTGDARSLSSGISEALITTECGLIIAIPALILHALLRDKVKEVIANMEQTAVAFINRLNEANPSL